MPVAGEGGGGRWAPRGSLQAPLVKPRPPRAAAAGPGAPAPLLGGVGPAAAAREAPRKQLLPSPCPRSARNSPSRHSVPPAPPAWRGTRTCRGSTPPPYLRRALPRSSAGLLGGARDGSAGEPGSAGAANGRAGRAGPGGGLWSMQVSCLPGCLCWAAFCRPWVGDHAIAL